MADKTGFIIHNGKEIFYVDYTDVNDAEALRERIARAESVLLGSGKNGLLELIDVTGSYAEPESLELLKESAKITTPHVSRSAIVGVSGVKKILLDFVNRFSGMRIEPKPTLEEAKDWLVRD